jgi:hypothetical protein
VVVDKENAHHVTERALIPRSYAVRKIYRDIFFTCDIQHVKVSVNGVAVHHNGI